MQTIPMSIREILLQYSNADMHRACSGATVNTQCLSYSEIFACPPVLEVVTPWQLHCDCDHSM